MGAIYKRGHVYWIKYYQHGKPLYESAKSGNPADARALLRQREGAIERGVPVSPRASKVTVAEIFQALLDDYKANERSSLPKVQQQVDRLHGAFGARRAAEITTQDLRAYILERQEAGASNATVNRELAVVRRAYAIAVREGRLGTRPYVPRLREENARQGFFEEHQVQAVLRRLPVYAQLPVRFMHATGWRKRNVLDLRWADVTEEGIRVPGAKTKNRKALLFPWTAEIRAIVDEARAATDAAQRERGAIIPQVFHRAGEPMADFRKVWYRACKEAGCPGMLRHDFRRTAARNLVRLGIPERVVMELVGWRTRAMLDRYNIVSAGDLAEAARKVDAGR
jgi:integrase